MHLAAGFRPVADPGGRMGDASPPPARTMLPFEKVETRVRTIGLSVLFQLPDDDADR